MINRWRDSIIMPSAASSFPASVSAPALALPTSQPLHSLPLQEEGLFFPTIKDEPTFYPSVLHQLSKEKEDASSFPSLMDVSSAPHLPLQEQQSTPLIHLETTQGILSTGLSDYMLCHYEPFGMRHVYQIIPPAPGSAEVDAERWSSPLRPPPKRKNRFSWAQDQLWCAPDGSIGFEKGLGALHDTLSWARQSNVTAYPIWSNEIREMAQWSQRKRSMYPEKDTELENEEGIGGFHGAWKHPMGWWDAAACIVQPELEDIPLSSSHFSRPKVKQKEEKQPREREEENDESDSQEDEDDDDEDNESEPQHQQQQVQEEQQQQKVGSIKKADCFSAEAFLNQNVKRAENHFVQMGPLATCEAYQDMPMTDDVFLAFGGRREEAYIRSLQEWGIAFSSLPVLTERIRSDTERWTHQLGGIVLAIQYAVAHAKVAILDTKKNAPRKHPSAMVPHVPALVANPRAVPYDQILIDIPLLMRKQELSASVPKERNDIARLTAPNAPLDLDAILCLSLKQPPSPTAVESSIFFIDTQTQKEKLYRAPLLNMKSVDTLVESILSAMEDTSKDLECVQTLKTLLEERPARMQQMLTDLRLAFAQLMPPVEPIEREAYLLSLGIRGHPHMMDVYEQDAAQRSQILERIGHQLASMVGSVPPHLVRSRSVQETQALLANHWSFPTEAFSSPSPPLHEKKLSPEVN